METPVQEKGLDRRQKKTRHAIQTALMALMADKPLDKITVSELAAKADINRKTFYNHYATIQEVRRELDQQYIDTIFSFMEQTEPEELTRDPSPFVHQLVRAMVLQPVRARLIFESGESIYLAGHMRSLVLPYVSRMAQQHNIPASYLNYALEYIVYGALAMLNSWVHAEYPLSPQEMERMLSALIRSCTSLADHYGTE